ncbi:MAG: host-nuclease inhibitor Gam family protein [Candidatus Dormibacteria bacterium]
MTTSHGEPRLSSPAVEAAAAAQEHAGGFAEGEPAVDLGDAQSYCEHAMRKLRKLAAAQERTDADRKAQIGEIEAWHKQETGRLLGEVHRLRMEMAPRVRALIEADPLGRKSVELVAGRAGFRRSPGKLIVDDEAAAIDWLDASLFRGQYVRTVRSVDVRRLKDAAAERLLSLDDVPGVHLEEGSDAFFTEPITAP